MSEAVIVDCVRTGLAKSFRGSFNQTRPDDLVGHCIRSLMDRNPKTDPAILDDCVVGCGLPEGPQGMNVGRVVTVVAGERKATLKVGPEIDGSASVVQAYLSKRIPEVGAPPIGEGVGVRLTGARLTQIGGQPVVRYDYRAYGKPLTAFRFISQRPRDPFLDPEVVESSPGQPDGQNEGVVLDRLAGYALLHSMRDGELVSIVTDLDGPKLLHLLRTPTYF